jgi:hypothetical protein
MTTKKTKLTDGAPDYFYWCKMGCWRVEQAITLLLELDPRDVLQDMQLAPEVSSDIKRRYSDLHRLLESHIGYGGYSTNMPPTEYIEWAQHNGIPVPGALLDAGKKQGLSLVSCRDECEKLHQENSELRDVSEKALPVKNSTTSGLKKEIGALHKILLAIAVDRHGYKLDGTNSSAPQKIANIVGQCGLKIDRGTVLKHLNEANDAYGHQLVDPR